MKRLALITVALFFVFAIGVGLLALVQPAEPTYRGLAASAWFEQMRGGDTNAIFAFRALGTNGVPFLINRLDPNHSRAERWYVALWQKLKPAWRSKLPPPALKDADAMMAMGLLTELGPQADAAVPAVCKLLVTPPTSSAVGSVFVKVPNRVVPGTLTPVTLGTESTRYLALHTLGAVGPHRPESLLAILQVAHVPGMPTCLSVQLSDVDWSPAVQALLPELVRRSTATNRHVRALAIDMLGSFGASDKTAVLALARGGSDDDDGIATQAITALGRLTNHFDIAVPALVSSFANTGPTPDPLSASDNSLRLPHMFNGTAAKSLIGLHTRTRMVVPALLAALTNSRPALRAGAAHALGELGLTEKGAARLRALHATESDANVRVHLAYALLRTGDAGPFLPFVAAALSGPSEGARWNATDVLGNIGVGRPDAVTALMRAVEVEPAERVRARMVSTFAKLGRPASAAIPLLERLQNDPHFFVREAATNAVLKIHSLPR